MKMLRVSAMVLALFTGATLAQADCPAEGFVLSAGNAFLAAARNGSPAAFTSAAARFADLRSIAMFALGPHRKSLPKAKEAEYVALARAYILQAIAAGADVRTGAGHGPLNHGFAPVAMHKRPLA